MTNDLTRWTVGWIDWNLLPDLSGGPNHVGNLCSAPILVDAGRDLLPHQISCCYIGHLSRFVKPGTKRVLCSVSRQVLEATAFANPDGTVATVVMNRSEQPVPFVLRIDDQRWRVNLPARATSTCLP